MVRSTSYTRTCIENSNRENLEPFHQTVSEAALGGYLPKIHPTTSVRVSASIVDRKVDAALQVISEESGIALEELTEDSNFMDMGIDSLNSMVIGSRLREDLQLDLDPNFSLFVNCTTVRDFRNFLHNSLSAAATVISVEQAVIPPRPRPLLETCKQSEAFLEKKIRPAHRGVVELALRIIAEESGVALEDLDHDTVFSDIGIDSLSSMVITSRFREELAIDLDADFNLFNDIPTVSRLSELLEGQESAESSEYDLDGSSQESISSKSTDTGSVKLSESPLQPYCRPTNSVILQGLPRVAKKTLFMLPDGGGSSSSYVTIPRLKGDLAVVGLNCPYARDPENMNCTHQSMIESFQNEIRRRQPTGPYHLGGWSSGGAFAYVVAESFINQGEEVHSLIIIDAPVPQVMEKLPIEFYEHCNSSGLFANQPGGSKDGSSAPPSYLIPHFVKVVDVMLDYKVAPLRTKRMPKVGIVWASETVMDEATAPKMKGMHFMVQKRTNYGPDGWDTVLPGANFDIVKVEGANHFTLMVS